MSDKDPAVTTNEVVDTTPAATPVVDEVAAKLAEFGAADDVVATIKNLGVDTLADLAKLTEPELVAAGLKLIKARDLVASIKPAAPVAETPVVSNTVFEAVLPEVQDDASWLQALKTGGVRKVDKSTVVAAIRAALAKQVGLYEVPAKLAAAMEAFADESEEQVDPSFFAIRKQVIKRGYAEIFDVIEGLDGSFVTDKRKNALLARLDKFLWPAIASFNDQLKGWQESYVQGATNPGLLMVSMMNRGSGALPPGIIQVPDTAVLRDAADAVIDGINKVFAGTGVQIASALAYEAIEVKKSLEDSRLPALIGVANREQMLKKLGVAVPATYPRLETNLIRYILGVLALEDQAAGDEEISYLSALFMLGKQIDWSQLDGRAATSDFRRIGDAGFDRNRI